METDGPGLDVFQKYMEGVVERDERRLLRDDFEGGTPEQAEPTPQPVSPDWVLEEGEVEISHTIEPTLGRGRRLTVVSQTPTHRISRVWNIDENGERIGEPVATGRVPRAQQGQDFSELSEYFQPDDTYVLIPDPSIMRWGWIAGETSTYRLLNDEGLVPSSRLPRPRRSNGGADRPLWGSDPEPPVDSDLDRHFNVRVDGFMLGDTVKISGSVVNSYDSQGIVVGMDASSYSDQSNPDRHTMYYVLSRGVYGQRLFGLPPVYRNHELSLVFRPLTENENGR